VSNTISSNSNIIDGGSIIGNRITTIGLFSIAFTCAYVTLFYMYDNEANRTYAIYHYTNR